MRTLKAQLTTLRKQYSSNSNSGDMAATLGTAAAATTTTTTTTTTAMAMAGNNATSASSELVRAAALGLGDVDYVLELLVESADLTPGAAVMQPGAGGNRPVFDVNSTTFIMADFYDYETQTTPLMTGLRPGYAFACSYKVVPDDFFLHHLASTDLALELNVTERADFSLVASGKLKLRDILGPAGEIAEEALELVSVREPHRGAVLGSLRVSARLNMPLDSLYAAFLREHPKEKERLERLDRAAEKEALERREGRRQEAALEVTVRACTGLRTASGRPPRAYVQYKFSHHEDVFTPIAQADADPVFDSTSAFPVVADRRLLRLLRRAPLKFRVFDDAVEVDETSAGRNRGGGYENFGIIGSASVDLAPLARGGEVSGSFNIVGDGYIVGRINVDVRWRGGIDLRALGIDPGTGLRLGAKGSSKAARAGGYAANSVGYEQLQTLMRRFDPELSGQIAWRQFCRYVTPAPDELRAEQRLRTLFAELKAEKKPYRSALLGYSTHGDRYGDDAETRTQPGAATGAGARIGERELRRCLNREFGFRLSEDESGAVFRVLDTDGDGNAGIDAFLAFALPLPVSSEGGALRSLERRLREHFSRMQAERPAWRDVFHSADATGVGLLSRRKFKKCLTRLDLELVGEPLDATSARDEDDWPAARGGRNGDNDNDNDGETAGRMYDDDDDDDDDDDNDNDGFARERGEALERDRAEFKKRMDAAGKATAVTHEIFRDEREDFLAEQGGGGAGEQEEAASRLQATFRKHDAERALRAARHYSRAAPDLGGGFGGEMDLLVEAEQAVVAAMRSRARAAFADEMGLAGPEDVEAGEELSTFYPDFQEALDSQADEEGMMPASRLGKALASCGASLPPILLATLAAHFSEDGEGGDVPAAAVSEFLAFALAGGSASAGNGGSNSGVDLPAIVSELRELSRGRVREAFESLDTDGDGVVTRKDFKKALASLGFKRLKPSQLKYIMAGLDPRGDGEVSYQVRSSTPTLPCPALPCSAPLRPLGYTLTYSTRL